MNFVQDIGTIFVILLMYFHLNQTFKLPNFISKNIYTNHIPGDQERSRDRTRLPPLEEERRRGLRHQMGEASCEEKGFGLHRCHLHLPP